MVVRSALSRRTFLASAAIAFLVVGGAVVLAVPESDPPKRKPEPVPTGSAPLGTPLAGITSPIAYGPFEVYPAGKHPGAVADLQQRLESEFPERSKWKSERADTTTLAALRDSDPAARSLAPSTKAYVPNGYTVAGEEGTVNILPDGSQRLVNYGAQLQHPNRYPVQVWRARPVEYELGLPYTSAEPDSGSTTMLTLARVAGLPALVFHTKPGITTVEYQEVWVSNGPILTVVSGYTADVQLLIDIATRLVEGDAR